MNASRDETPGRHRLAVAFMIGASCLIAATSIIAKTLGLDTDGASSMSPFMVSAGRFVFALLALTLLVALRPRVRPAFGGARWKWHVLRSLCGWLGVTAMFAAVARMAVAEATAISFLSPLVTVILAVLLLGENITARKLIAIALAILGAFLILKPGTGAFQLAGVYAFAAAVFMGLEAVFIKMLSDSEPALRVLIINNAIGATVSVCVACYFWTWPAPAQWLLLVLLGIVMVCGQALFIQAMKRGEASQVIPVFYSVLVFAALFDFALFHVAPDWLAALGAVFIVGSAIVLARSRNTGSITRP